MLSYEDFSECWHILLYVIKIVFSDITNLIKKVFKY